MTKKMFVLGGALVAGGLAAIAVGDLIAFQPGTAIKSGEVNQNFSMLRTAVAALEAPVGPSRLADGAVTLPKLAVGGAAADGRVLKLQGGALTWGDDMTGGGGAAYSAGAGLALSNNTFSIGLAGITSGMLADSAVTGGKLADGGVSAPKLADNAVTSSKLASDAASLARVSGGALTSSGGNTTATGNLTVNGSLDIGYGVFEVAGPLIQPSASFEQTASCPTGRRVLGAGYYNSTDNDVTLSHFLPSSDGTSWYAKGVNNTAVLTRLYIRLICARV